MAKKEIAKADLPILKSKVEDLVRQYNAAEKVEETTELDDKIKEAVNDYTCAARTIAFSEIKESPDAMLEAVKRLTYQTIGVKDVRPEGSKVAVREVIDKGRPIDLIKLENFCGHIGAEADWYDQCQKLNFLLTAKKAKDLGIDPREVNDSYAMSEIAKQIDLGKTPCSNTNMLKTTQKIVTAMLGGEYKATSHDVAYLVSVYSKKGKKALAVSCADHKRFVAIFAEVCNHIVTGAPYTVEFKAKKA